jgi:hypothetical protein
VNNQTNRAADRLPEEHSLTLERRARLTVTGVSEVLRVEENGVALRVGQSVLVVRGTELKLREEGGSREMVCVLPDEKQPEALKAVLSRWAPELCVLVKSPATAQKLSAIAPFTADMQAVDNKAAYYICKDGSCSLPIVQ